jgi:1,4-alpha-glucan branching enzyme
VLFEEADKMKGYLAMVFHTHLPYVRHADDPHALEQRWLFEAITESYIPLLNVFDQLARDGVSFRLTMSFTPPLMEMLADPMMQERYLDHLKRLIQLAEKEVVRLKHDSAFLSIAEMYLWKLREARYVLAAKHQGNLLRGFRKLAEAGKLELMTSAATHAYLPLIRSNDAVRAQISLGVRSFEEHFGWKPKGMWLPECGYRPGIDEILAGHDLKYFLVDSHALLHADPAPHTGVYAPVRTTSGLMAFARDMESAKQVWSAKEGYPGDHDYREYYRDVGWDLDWDYIRPYVHPDGIRVNTGLKYYRITGEGAHKEPYVPAWARQRAADHAGHFLHARWEQASRLSKELNQLPIIVSPYDTELFGHWWYEGPAFIDFVCRKLHFDQDDLALISPGDYPHNGTIIEAELPESSWGNQGYNTVWLNESNSWVYPHLHAAEERMVALAESRLCPTELERRALNQAGRELLLAQSSDWTFILSAVTATNYANRRLIEHLGWFHEICSQLETGAINENQIYSREQSHGIFPHMDYRVFADRSSQNVIPIFPPGALCVLMLSWEFPPMTVGGLGRHVYELSRALVRQGVEVHVATLGARGLPERDVVSGVIVHRTELHNLPGDSFIDWVFQLNLQLFELARQVWLRRRFDLVHGHDWLVGEASRMVARRYGLPLLATIHATEHGRNNGIHSPVQRSIDRAERELMAVSDRVVICSKAMQAELKGVFGMPESRLHVVPNGVDVASLVPWAGPPPIYLPKHGKVVAFLGRFVREKGVELLLEAATEILSRRSDVYFVLAGRGPLLDQLKHRAYETRMGDRILFPGFVDDRGRNALLARASVAVFPSLYEPFGIVALEAMGAGVPVVVSDTGGFGEIVEHGVDGWKVHPGDLRGLISTIEQVLDNEETADRVAMRGKEKTERLYTWEAVAEQTRAIYNALGSSRERDMKMALA